MGLFGKPKEEVRNRLLRDILAQKRYNELGVAGEGGIAQVASCFDVYLNRIVAVKQLKDAARENADLVRSFVNEVKLIGYLDHPGVISIFDTFVLENNRLSYSMKFIEGYSLAAEMERTKDPPTRSIVNSVKVITTLCETLAYVHDKGVIHLDLKPDNIMLGAYGQVLVMDWGNARLYDDQPFNEYVHAFAGGAEVAEFQQEREDIILGTPAYMSPEQTNTPRGDLTPASDIFSTGIILYELLADTHPFEGTTADEIMDNIREMRQPSPHEVNPDVPRRLSHICQNMLEKDMSHRYGSFHDILEDLRAFSESGQAFCTRNLQSGERVFAEGDTGDFAFTVVSGKVEVSRTVDGRKRVLAELGKGETVGELAIFTKEPRTATVTALDPTTIRIMNRHDVELELDKLSPWVGNMITGLSHRFNQLSDKLLGLAGTEGPP
ncbi:MAG: protein kinase [Chitinivibrionales bacterium]|nr:protein kinase [Chitinivibrionales bacterium]MBD3395830.1 protein kinase [Chitinivibrionales bacterium]